MKKLIVTALVLALALMLGACSVNDKGQIISGNRVTSGADIQRFDYAYVILSDRVIAEGKVEQWRDYQGSDTVQVLIDGNYYLTHYNNVVLVSSVQNPLNMNHN